MIKVIILDLDDTLIDTKALEPLRKTRNWKSVSNYLIDCKVYDEVLGLLNAARSFGIKIAIFTNSPSNYVNTLLRHFGISVDLVIAFHDVQNHKPAPEGVFKVINYFQVSNEEVIYIGDSDLDRLSAENAGVEFFAVEWGNVGHIDDNHLGLAGLSELIGRRTSSPQDSVSRSELLTDGNKLYLGYYLDGIKQELWAFKNGSEPAITRWTRKVKELAPEFPAIDIVIRALGHAELTVENDNKPLDRLANEIAISVGATYCSGALSKSKILQKSTSCSAFERAFQVKGTYSLNISYDVIRSEQPCFLIVDDVYTSGATTTEIQRAITQAYPKAKVYVFTLLKTIYRLESKQFSGEAQHNNLLLYDLHNITKEVNKFSGNVKSYNELHFSKLQSKRFSANYTNTNNNFVIFNLPNYSIASESTSQVLFSSLQILKNILQRGKPTIASRRLRAAFGFDIHESGFDLAPLPLISRKSVQWERLIRGEQRTSKYPAKHFFNRLLPKYLGEYSFIKQMIVPEVKIFDMTQVYVEQFHNRQVDFYIPHVGIIIEIDGQQHQSTTIDDEKRDIFVKTLGLKTFRFSTAEVQTENEIFLRKMESLCNYIRYIDRLEQEKKLIPPNGLTLGLYSEQYTLGKYDISDVRLRLTASVRFQLLLIELIERGVISLGKPYKIILINRDQIDFASHALEDLNELLGNLNCLSGLSLGLLEIQIEEVNELPPRRDLAAILVDFSILQRYDDEHQVNPDTFFIRTDYFDFYRNFPSGDALSIENSILVDQDYFRMSCSSLIKYTLDLSPESEQRRAIRFFLANLFLPFLDEVDFREGQIGIIGSALSLNSTIGLLPTGSGKSICYQLSAILQPAVSFVVCPIKSLMYDQKIDLDGIGFTRSNYITGDLKPEEKARVQEDFGRGKYFFVFISPERFQTRKFRSEMLAIGLDLAFAYAVIDEAHCLSEWGHDFRTSYLNLANTISRFAPKSTYIGLTATASVNVLKDIQTEFNIPDEYVRTPLNFTRDELSFHVIDDGGLKEDAVTQLVREMDVKWNSSLIHPKAGIIFTPTVNGDRGCYQLASRLTSSLQIDVRFFSGTAPKNSKFKDSEFEQYKRKVQNDFKDNKYNLLTATKAFGMGVNKGNIAYTIHYGIPGSMEALYQEAGRAGRDKRLFQNVPADCYVLLTKEHNDKLLEKIWSRETNVAGLKENVRLLHRQSDLNTNLFLMTNGLDTINDESKLIYRIYEYLHERKNDGIVTLNASDFIIEKTKLEKSVYRLFQLGVVSDWTVEDFFNGTFKVECKSTDVKQLEFNLVKSIKKYDSKFCLEEIYNSDSEYYRLICVRLEKEKINRVQFVFLVLLIWSYEHFVYNRRQSQKNVYEQCLAVANQGPSLESDFKARLEGYFRHDKSSLRLLHLAENYVDTKQWLSVFYAESNDESYPLLINIDEIKILGGQISRFLESYKNNPCLDYLSGIFRLSNNQFDDTDGSLRMSSAFDKLIFHNRDSAVTLVRETLKLKSIFSEDARSLYAQLVHDKFCDFDLLEEVNSVFEDPYSYQTLLTPLASKIEMIIKRYKGINW